MDRDYESFKNILLEKKEKYPNICKLWESHINQMKNNYSVTLNRAIEVLKTIETKSNEDLPMDTIALLYFLFQENIP